MRTNPLKAKRQQVGLSQAELAAAASVTRQVVVLAEQGLYKQPPPSLMRALCRTGVNSNFGYKEQAVLLAEYAGWVETQRYAHAHLFRDVDLRLAANDRWDALKSQVLNALGTRSKQAFCRALVYQPSLIKEFEKYGRGSASIFAALRQVQLPDAQLALLAESVVILSPVGG